MKFRQQDCCKISLRSEQKYFISEGTGEERAIGADSEGDVWSVIGQLKDNFGIVMFANLAAFRKGVLSIPHSSAHCERIFSTVRKNKTDKRVSLDDDTLEVLVLKIKSDQLTLTDETA